MPLNKQQVGLIIWLFLNEISFWVYYMPKVFSDFKFTLDSPLLISLVCVHTVIFIMMVVNGALASLTDTTDNAIYYQRYLVEQG